MKKLEVFYDSFIKYLMETYVPKGSMLQSKHEACLFDTSPNKSQLFEPHSTFGIENLLEKFGKTNKVTKREYASEYYISNSDYPKSREIFLMFIEERDIVRHWTKNGCYKT